MASEATTKQLYGPPKVGGDVLSYCTRCKMELAHVIVSMIDTRPAKVLCKTCRTQHNFRKSGGEPLARASSRRSGLPKAARVPVAVIRTADLWEKKIAESKGHTPRSYSPKDVFAKGEVIQHAKFGMGVVEDTSRKGKVSVFFKDGDKILVHGLANAP